MKIAVPLDYSLSFELSCRFQSRAILPIRLLPYFPLVPLKLPLLFIRSLREYLAIDRKILWRILRRRDVARPYTSARIRKRNKQTTFRLRYQLPRDTVSQDPPRCSSLKRYLYSKLPRRRNCVRIRFMLAVSKSKRAQTFRPSVIKFRSTRHSVCFLTES